MERDLQVKLAENGIKLIPAVTVSFIYQHIHI